MFFNNDDALSFEFLLIGSPLADQLVPPLISVFLADQAMYPITNIEIIVIADKIIEKRISEFIFLIYFFYISMISEYSYLTLEL